MLAEMTQKIPSYPGTYLFWLHLLQSQNLAIGRLGFFTFPAGDYVYLGSAHGPGGLRARLGRHLRGGGKTHWHIDILRKVASVRGFGYTTDPNISECVWSKKIAAHPDARIPIPGFGASDCREGCTTHLVYFSTLDTGRMAKLLNSKFHVLSFE